MTTQLQSPVPWPFPNPVVPPNITTSGQGYTVDGNGQISVEDEDVAGLVALGFSQSTGKTIAGTSYTIVPADRNGTLSFTATSAVTLTVPNGLWAPGFICYVIQSSLISGGNITFTPGDDTVTILAENDNSGTPTLLGQYSLGILVANPAVAEQWILGGNVG